MDNILRIIDNKDTKTYLYKIVENKILQKENNEIEDNIEDIKKFSSNNVFDEMFIIQKLMKTEKKIGDKVINEFNIFEEDNISRSEEYVVLIVKKEKVSVNIAKIWNEKLEISKTNYEINFKEIENTKEKATFKYTPKKDRKIFLVNIENGEIISPQLYFIDQKQVGICELELNKKYFAIEIRNDKKTRKLVFGICSFNKEIDKFKTFIGENEAKRIDIDKELNKILKGDKIILNLIKKNEIEKMRKFE